MEQAPCLDNEEVLFDFDPYEPPSRRSNQDGALDIIQRIIRMDESGQHDREPDVMLGKGKGPSLPISIPAASSGPDSSVISRGLPPNLEGSSSQPPFIPVTGEHKSDSAKEANFLALEDHDILLLPSESPSNDDCTFMNASLPSKGKEKELAYTLPPFSFSSSDLECRTIDWPSSEPGTSTAGPSSYGSTHSSPPRASPSGLSQTSPQVAENSTQQQPELTRVPSRRRSLSSLSIHSTHSIAARSMSRIKVKLGSSPNSPGNLARRLLFRNKGDAAATSIDLNPAGSVSDPCLGDIVSAGQGLASWKGPDFFSPHLDFPSDTRPHVQRSISGLESLGTLKGKGKVRSYSSPFPQYVLDIIPHDNSDVFVPLPVTLRNLFDEVLPRELKLQVFSALISLHEAELQRWKQSGQWTVLRASSSKHRWAGRDRGMRELVKLSRVSKAWRSLVFDGQLWMEVDLKAFPNLPVPFLLRLAETLGPFIKNMDLTGHVKLDHTTLGQVTTSLCVRSAPTIDFAYTQLLDVNLTGCNELTTQSLHDLIIHSPFLRSLCVKGLDAVNNTTFGVLAICPHLTSLNMSRCPNVNGKGLRGYANAALERQGQLALKELRLCGVVDIYDEALGALGRAAPSLEVLDLSYCRTLHNSALEAFVACTEDDRGMESVVLTAREVGREARDNGRYRRRITKLRHLSLSNCRLLTDIACSNLAHAVPRLELLELASIGTEMKDEGIVRLLRTTPLLRKLDLEDDTDITDAVMRALTPNPPDEFAAGSTQPLQTGQALEHLVVSCATSIGNEAFFDLIRNCPRLTVLEADSTGISGNVLKEFVRQARERNLSDATLVAVDCRGVGEGTVKDVAATTRPRKGWCAWDARKLAYLDARDKEDLKVGQDECDEKRVVLKSFYNWQTVDTVRSARERRRRNSRHPGSSDFASDLEDVARVSGRTRWWSPSGRRSLGANTPDGTFNDRDGCIMM
ncbi:RNI-like protein [Rhizopogon vinicolor AM-OR11-026]|uniref:RNI-like protein n=1 Tax=Rhizopogon vinicolor AM-OR11-026 TaxID=1314800 RepID=A0A1B7NB40_9AGAM|nr:RNI-like protein [Rhizopogon vinicolor AM-OR11-026]